MPYFDRFDICEAHYLFYCHFHSGMGSREYERLSKMTEYFTPCSSLRFGTLSENGREIYEQLAEKEENKG